MKHSILKALLASFDSSVGRAVDCSGVDIHRSLVRIRLEGFFFIFPANLCRSEVLLLVQGYISLLYD